MDQLYVQSSLDTPFPRCSSASSGGSIRGCAYGLACVYTDTISGRAGPAAAVGARPAQWSSSSCRRRGNSERGRCGCTAGSPRHADGSIAGLRRSLTFDRSAWTVTPQHREIEQRISRIERASQREARGPGARQASGFVRGHVKMDFDLQSLRSRRTRPAFLVKMSRDAPERLSGSGIDRGFHDALASRRGRRTHQAVCRDQQYHVSMLPYFLEKLQARWTATRTCREDARHLRVAMPSATRTIPELPADPPGPSARAEGGLHVKRGGHAMANVFLRCGGSVWRS